MHGLKVPFQQHIHHCQQFAGVVGFGEVVVPALLQTLHFVGNLPFAGEENHGVIAVLTEGLANIVAAAVG